MNRIAAAQELTKIAKLLTSGGWGRFSDDLSDALQSVVMQHPEKDDRELIRLMKENAGDLMKEERMTDRDLKKYLADNFIQFMRERALKE